MVIDLDLVFFSTELSSNFFLCCFETLEKQGNLDESSHNQIAAFA